MFLQKRVFAWAVTSALLLPALAGLTLAAMKAQRLGRLGYPLRESAEMALVISAELLILSLTVTLPVILVLGTCESRWPAAARLRVRLPLAVLAVLVLVGIYEAWWGSISVGYALSWASGFFIVHEIVMGSRVHRPVV